MPLRTLLSKEYAATLCDKLDPERARPADVRGNIPGGTVYLTVGDRWGNMVSFVDTISGFFGSYPTVPGYGFLLNNRGANFTLEEGHPNQVAPRKRPFITITAGFITKDGQPLMAFGNKGGTTQPQAQAQHVVNMVDLGMNVQATADAARFDHDQVSDTLGLDTGQLGLVGPQLTELGHRVVQARGQSGVYQGLLFERDRNARPARMPPRGTPCCPGALETNRGRSRLFEQPLNGCTARVRICGRTATPAAGERPDSGVGRPRMSECPRSGTPLRGRPPLAAVGRASPGTIAVRACRRQRRRRRGRQRRGPVARDPAPGTKALARHERQVCVDGEPRQQTGLLELARDPPVLLSVVASRCFMQGWLCRGQGGQRGAQGTGAARSVAGEQGVDRAHVEQAEHLGAVDDAGQAVGRQHAGEVDERAARVVTLSPSGSRATTSRSGRRVALQWTRSARGWSGPGRR